MKKSDHQRNRKEFDPHPTIAEVVGPKTGREFFLTRNTFERSNTMDEIITTSNRNTMSIGDVLSQLNHEQERKVDVVLKEHQDMTAVVPVVGVHTEDGGHGDRVPATTPMIQFADSVPEVGGETFPIQEVAHRQLSEKTGIPLAYYRRMAAEAPILWAENVNHWFRQDGRRRLVRSFRTNGEDGRVRAFLSDRFKILDNIPFITSVLQAVEDEVGGDNLEVQSAHVDEDRVYLKVLTQEHRATQRGDVVRQGIVVSNSEVGSGKVKIQPFSLYLACTNGMISTMNFGKVHLGSELGEGFLTRETINLRAETVWSEVRDFTVAALGSEHIDLFVRSLNDAEEVEIQQEPRIAIANVVKTFGLTGGQGNRLLDRYLRDAGSNGETQFGVVQATTFEAHESPTFREGIELEELGGKLLGMSGREFTRMLSKPVTDKELDRAFTNRSVA